MEDIFSWGLLGLFWELFTLVFLSDNPVALYFRLVSLNSLTGVNKRIEEKSI